MNTELYLIRHGETEWNKLGKFQGCTDIPLSEDGIQQAFLLQKRLKGNFDCIYTSPLSRAVKTAQILCQPSCKKEPVIHPGLIEINFGKWEGLTLEDINREYSLEFKRWKTDEETAPIMGGELSLKNACVRVTKAILDIVQEHKGETIVIVSHGGVLKAALIGLFGWKMTMYQNLFLGNTSLSKLTFRSDLTPYINTLNDINHLLSD